MGWILLFCALQGGCRAPAEQVVARVGEQVIAVQDYDQMAAVLLEGPFREMEQIDGEARQRLLETMIAKELLLMEARARRLDQDPELAAEVARLEERLLINALYERQGLKGAEVSEAEVERYFHEGEFDREIRLGHILCATPEEAEQALALLRQGAAFEALAAERSIHRPSGQRGGDMGFMPLAHMLPEVREAVLSLQPGQVYPAPVQSRYGFHVFRVIDRRAADFSARRGQVAQALETRQRAARRAAYRDSLKRALALDCGAGQGEMLCTWKGGALSREDYFRATGRQASGDSAALRQAAAEVAMRRILMAEARRLGYHLDQGLRTQVRRRQEELLAERLRAQVRVPVAASEEELRAFHAAHPELYGARPVVEIQEVLVESQELAAQLRQRLEAGENLEELAAQYHTRAATRERGGRMWVALRDNPLLGSLAPAALDGEPGALYGPLEVPGGFSLFRVAQRSQIPAQPFEQLRPSIAAVLRLQAQNEALEQFLSELKTRYAAAIQVYPQGLALTLRDYAPRRAREEPAEASAAGWN